MNMASRLAALTAKKTSISSTIGIDMQALKIFKGKTTAAVWDFAGQPEYTTTHQVNLYK